MTKPGVPIALFLVGIVTILGACQGRRFTFPTVEQLSRPAAEWAVRPAASEESSESSSKFPLHLGEQLERGRVLAVTECSDCHRQYWPIEYAVDEWPSIIERMGRRASLDPDEVEDLRVYFDHASRWAHGLDGPTR